MFSLPDLGYEYDALGGYISADIMRLHHGKHHQTYVDKLNAALEQTPLLKEQPLGYLLSHLDNIPDTVRSALRNHRSGHYNHSLFWQ
jgi:Fe-Mn family superoxide dismutase